MTVGVLLMAHGTPASATEIESFYTRIRRGRPPTPEQLADLERRYAAIGGASPLNIRTTAQVDAVRDVLGTRRPVVTRCRSGPSTRNPSLSSPPPD